MLRSSSCSSENAKFTAVQPPGVASLWGRRYVRPIGQLSTRPGGQEPLGDSLGRMSTLLYDDTQAEIHKVVVGPMDNNVYVLRCRETGDAVLIDAANEHELLLELCRDLGVRTVLETHGHWDHIQAVPAVRDAGYEVGITAADADMLDAYDYVLADDSVIDVGRLRLHTILTPGHTPGSMCFRIEGSPVLFSGDTLFPGGPGQHQLPGWRLPHDHRVHRPAPVRAARRRHHRAARPRRPDHDRHRAPEAAGMGRPRLVVTSSCWGRPRAAARAPAASHRPRRPA